MNLHHNLYSTANAQPLPTLVLLHGLCESSHFWHEIAKKLQAKANIISIDLPGFGKSPLLSNITTLASIADEVHAVLMANQVNKCVMIGHSLGGYVALAFAEKYAHTLLGVGLCNSTALADTADKKDKRNKLIESLEQNGIRPFLSSFFQGLFAPQNVQKFEQQIETLQQEAKNISVETLIKITEILRDRPDYSHVLKKLACPALFIVGKEDTVLPLQLHQEIFLMPQHTTLYLQENVGHLSVIEAPQQTTIAIESFLAICTSKK
jgi:pimeloyl-ACP methyl ester carboxylesterase